MRNTNGKGKTKTRKLQKCNGRFIAHNEVQWVYAETLENDESIAEIKCNVKLQGCELGDNYSTDFVCTQTNGELLVVETIEKKHLFKPLSCKQLDASRNYWMRRGVSDFRLVIGGRDEEE